MTPDPHKLMVLIAKMEGFYRPGSIPQRLNNPGDLVFVGQPFAKGHQVKGADGKIRTYAEFDSEQHGWDALERQLRRYVQRDANITLLGAIQKWAPAADNNDPKGYAAFVAKQLGVPLETKLSEILG